MLKYLQVPRWEILSYIYNINDGSDFDQGARITSDGSQQYIILDLGASSEFDRIDIYPSGKSSVCGIYYPGSIDIQVSEDNRSYTTVIQASGYTVPPRKVPVFRFDKVKARFVKLLFTSLVNEDNFCEIGEVKIYNNGDIFEDDISTPYRKPLFVEGSNLALNKPVLGYSSTTDVSAWLCMHTGINDGDYAMGWASALFVNDEPDAEEWICIDLLDIYNVNKVIITPRNLFNGLNVFPEDYEIQVSTDNITYTTVKKVTGDNVPQSQDIRILEFTDTPCRYVKLLATKLSHSGTATAGYCIELNEMEVYGNEYKDPSEPEPDIQNINLALNKPIQGYSSTIDVPEWLCIHTGINDGDPSTVWASSLSVHEIPEAEEWICIDLEKTYNVNKVILVPRSIYGGVNVFPEDYEIQVSMDNVTYTTVKKITGDNVPQSQTLRILEFTDTPCRYVKLLCTKLSHSGTATAGFTVELSEMEIYGKEYVQPHIPSGDALFIPLLLTLMFAFAGIVIYRSRKLIFN